MCLEMLNKIYLAGDDRIAFYLSILICNIHQHSSETLYATVKVTQAYTRLQTRGRLVQLMVTQQG